MRIKYRVQCAVVVLGKTENGFFFGKLLHRKTYSHRRKARAWMNKQEIYGVSINFNKS